MSKIARHAEDAGFDAVALDEHPAPPQSWREHGDGHDAIDPFVGLAGVAAATERIQLLTYLAVLPYRNPFLTAKAAATVDVLSEGRLILGVGTGYLPEEFAALGRDFEDRNAAFDEALEVLRLAWSGRPVDYSGRDFTAKGVVALPTPFGGRVPPIWVGGNSTRALRRAAQFGDGWLAMPNRRQRSVSRHSAALETLADLRQLIGRLRGCAAESGRGESFTPDVMYILGASGGFPSPVHDLQALADAGVTWVTAAPPPDADADACHRWLDTFRTEIIDAYGAAAV